MSLERSKNAASKKALEFVEDGMRIGLGTGSTTALFISHLIEKCKAGLNIQAAATSLASEKMAREGGIPMLDISKLTALDLTIDGADAIDPKKRLIKGAGGALVREKIIATMSAQMIVVADESKLVANLGATLLPVEIIPFAPMSTKEQLESLGFPGTFRKNPDGSPYITDNHNWILDITLPNPLEHPEEAHMEMIKLPGVVETGFFFHLANRIVIGKEDGSAIVQN